MSLFSIITVNLNNAEGLKKTMESVMSQTFNDYEYIVIDGASTDGSVNVIKNYEPKISFSLSEEDSGIYNAMNKGVKKATGKYLLFLNSGDQLAGANVLDEVAELDSQEDLVYGNMLIKESNGKISNGKMPDKLSSIHMLKDTLWHPATFILRKAFNDFGYYDERFKIAADYECFLYLIFKRRSSYRHLNMNISIFDKSGMSANQDNIKLLKEERLIAQKKYFNPLLLTVFRFYCFIRN